MNKFFTTLFGLFISLMILMQAALAFDTALPKAARKHDSHGHSRNGNSGNSEGGARGSGSGNSNTSNTGEREVMKADIERH